ncbi:aromatic amino acid transport family protein, partial [Klebsiella pneumoniae]|uniref:aromatic amino acid transport family protein n=1 Tax=Klebsiella pneumoniae TaxID=573 RepID=UPI0027D85852
EEWCFGYLRGVALSDWSTLPAELQPELDAIALHGSEEQFSALIMPALLVMKSRREHPQATWRVAGGAPTLWLVLLCGIGIVA